MNQLSTGALPRHIFLSPVYFLIVYCIFASQTYSSTLFVFGDCCFGCCQFYFVLMLLDELQEMSILTSFYIHINFVVVVLLFASCLLRTLPNIIVCDCCCCCSFFFGSSAICSRLFVSHFRFYVCCCALIESNFVVIASM